MPTQEQPESPEFNLKQQHYDHNKGDYCTCTDDEINSRTIDYCPGFEQYNDAPDYYYTEPDHNEQHSWYNEPPIYDQRADYDYLTTDHYDD